MDLKTYHAQAPMVPEGVRDSHEVIATFKTRAEVLIKRLKTGVISQDQFLDELTDWNNDLIDHVAETMTQMGTWAAEFEAYVGTNWPKVKRP